MLNMNALLDIEDAVAKIRNTKYTRTALADLQKALNKFFSDSECKEVLYTENISKPFFGMSVYVSLNPKTTQSILTNDEPIRLSKYWVEIDSKLFTDKKLTTKETTACLIHEIGHVIDDSTPVDTFRKVLDSYFAETRSNIDYVKSSAYWDFLAYGIQDSFRRMYSIFYMDRAELVADQFVVACGYGESLESAFCKINNSGEIGPKLQGTKAFRSKLVIMQWVLNMYSKIGIFRMSSIRTLNKMKTLTGSKLEKDRIEDAINSLQDINPSLQIRECVCENEYEAVIINPLIAESSSNTNLVTKIQRKGLKGIEDDLYEYTVRVSNLSDESDAIYILRQINTRLSMLDDWIEHNPTDSHIDRYRKLYHKYELLREDLINKSAYSKKQYGIWFDYDSIPNNPKTDLR